MSLETRRLLNPEKLAYPAPYGSIQADHDGSEYEDDIREPLFKNSSVISVASFSEVSVQEVIMK